MRLYHHPMSLNARRAVMTAVHLGIDVELVFVDLAKGAQRAPEFVRLNANAKVPVLDDDGFILTESHAIMQYLADTTPGQTVYPAEVRPRADVNRWLFWCAYHFTPAVGILNWENAIKGYIGAGPADAEQVKRGEALFSDCARVLDGHLADKSWIAQDRLTLADLAIGAALAVTASAKLPVAGHANLQRWFGRVQELGAWKKTGA